MKGWTEGVDYYMNEEGFVVLTAKFHLDRGYCCGNGCKHCPYDYQNVREPKRSELRARSDANGDSKSSK
jgi:hypothetical protein